MKRFVKSVAGKTILFIVCVLSFLLFAVSLFGVFFYAENDFYSLDQSKIEEIYVSARIRQDIYPFLYERLINPDSQELVKENDIGNLIFRIRDNDKVLLETESASGIETWDYSYTYDVLWDPEGKDPQLYYGSVHSQSDETADTCFVDAAINKDGKRIDFYSQASFLVGLVYRLRFAVFLFLGLSLLFLIVSFITLMCVAGRRNTDDGLYPGPLNPVPADFLCAVFIAAFGFSFLMVDRFRMEFVQIVCLIAVFLLLAAGFIGLCMSIAVHIKQRNLISTFFIYHFLTKTAELLKLLLKVSGKGLFLLAELLKGIPSAWKILSIFAVSSFLEILSLEEGNEEVWLFIKILLFLLLAYCGICMRKLQQASHAMANGDLNYQADTKYLFDDFRKQAEDLNHISKGMSIAVEERMKSERMKTELISNVSHDIKTPLTSIISYADLIGSEATENEKIREYAMVLVRQSQRLKRLLEDLVEVSKASSGNLETFLAPLDAGILLEQCQGEYADRMKASGLTLITQKPEEPLMIMADHRRMYRIFDNLMNNIIKYALENTRVYLSLERKDNNAIFTFKNTSRDALNIPAEELMERFKRGDESRNSEGNGLGLSIAESLSEIQNGSLKLQIDGDLFKAILCFPVI